MLIVSGNPDNTWEVVNEEEISSHFNGKIKVFHPTQGTKIFQGFMLRLLSESRSKCNYPFIYNSNLEHVSDLLVYYLS